MELELELLPDEKYICSFCKKPINSGEKVLLNFDGNIKINGKKCIVDVEADSIYHLDCLCENFPDDVIDNSVTIYGYMLCVRKTPCEKCEYLIKKCRYGLVRSD